MVVQSQAAQGTAVAARDTSPVGQLQAQLQSRARDIQMALPGHITPDKFQRTVLTAVAQNPDLLKADRQSLILSVYKAAQDGLLPDGREAALVTFNTRRKTEGGRWESVKQVQYMPMVYGLRKKILQSGDVVALEVGVVYKIEQENGYFRYEVGTEPPLNHAPMLDIPEEEATDDKMIAAYSIATIRLPDGGTTKSYDVMRRSEVMKVRQMSQTGALGQVARYDMGDIKKGQPVPPKGPWVDWAPEMWKKTVMRRHSKTLPMSGDILMDIEGRELERGASAAYALGVQPDAPELLTDDTDGSQYDGSTGEVVDEGNGAAAEDTESSAQQPKPAEENGSTATTATEQRGAPQSDTVFDSETAETRQKQEQTAEEILEAMSKSKDLTSLKTVYDDNQLDLAGLPIDLAEAVEGGYERNLKRLGSTRTKIAREVAQAAAARQAEPVK